MINFDKIKEIINPNFKDGDGDNAIRMFSDDKVKIMRITLKKGCSIGHHAHETNCEIIYIISGQAKCILDGKEEILNPGESSYCPKGSAHTTINNGDKDLVFFAVVAEQ